MVDAGAGESQPLRSGSFLVDARSNGVVGPLYGCFGSPDCLPWMLTCVGPVLQRDGLTASIVDVSKLAGLRRTRRFAVTDRVSLPGDWGGVTIELWTRSCEAIAIPGHRGGVFGVSTATFTIPKDAAWMTVTSGMGWLSMASGWFDVHWQLR
jgi:hypothetical protein